MAHQIDPAKLAKAREDQVKVDLILGEMFDGEEKEKQVNASDLLLEQIRILETVRLRCRKLIAPTPLGDCQAFQDALTTLDYSVQVLKQQYESSAYDEQEEKPCTGESEGVALNQSRPLEGIKTDDLISELILRDGIERIHTGLYQWYELRKQYSTNREVISAVVLISEKNHLEAK